MLIEELAKQAGVKSETVKRRLDDIQGVVQTNDKISFIKGTRFPYEKNKVSIKEAHDRYYAVLKATSRNRFIDHKYLNISKESFDVIIEELLKIDYLVDNKTNNLYGANAYDLSFKGSSAVQKAKYIVLREIVSLLSALI